MKTDIYDKNYEKIEAKFPTIAKALKETELGSDHYLIDNNDGVEYLLYQKDDGTFIQYTSMVDITAECDEYMEKLDFTFNRTAIILTAIRVGEMAERIMKKLNDKSVLFCCERDMVLLKDVLHRRDFSKYIEDEKIIFISDDLEGVTMQEQVRGIVRTVFPNVIAKTQPVIFPIFDKAYITFSKEVLKSFQEEKNYVQFAIGNNVDDTLVGLDQYLLNNDEMLKKVGINQFKKTIKETYKGKPAIVVASGPSLNNNVHLLKDIDDKALILSCDGSVKMLKKHGVKIDAVGSVERTHETYECFYEKEEFPEETVLVCPTVVDPRIPKKFDKSILFPKTGLGDSQWVSTFSFGEKGTMLCGPSVSHMLYMFAEECGCEPIILIGQDLAYSKDGRSHNSEAGVVMESFEDEKKRTEEAEQKEYDCYIEDINGDMVPTTYIWQMFHQAYEDMLCNTETLVIDASEGGARIKGTEVIPLQRVIDTYMSGEETIPPLYEAYSWVKQEADFYKRARLYGYESIVKKLDVLIDFRKRVLDAVDMIEECVDIVEDEIENQKQLDFVYDTIEFAGDDLLTEIRKDNLRAVLFNYYIKVALCRLNYVEGSTFTKENIKYNILILDQLYEMISLYTSKTVRLLIEHQQKEYAELIALFPEEDIEAKEYGTLYDELNTEKYEIPLWIYLGYDPAQPRRVNLDAR